MQSILRPQSDFADPFPLYRQMQRECPVSQDREADVWMLFCYADCRSLLTAGQARVPVVKADGLSEPARTVLGHLARLANGADHSYFRGLAAVIFRECRLLDPVHCLRDLIAGDREFDWVDRVARVLPLRLLLDGLGFAPDAMDFLIRSVPVLTGLMLPGRTAAQARDINAVLPDCVHLAAQRLQELGLTGLDRKAAAANLIGLLIQSYDAGRGLLTNALVQALHRGWPEDMHRFVIETLRFDPPIHNTKRVLAAPTIFGDVTIPAGSLVVAQLSAANRDPAHFDDPDRFDPNRVNNSDHLTFGIGAHRCLADHFMVDMAAKTLAALRDCWPALRAIQGDDAVEPLVNARLRKALVLGLDGLSRSAPG